jgi:1-acyl-sn-glycerol-3-phosphate acyltransferase
MVRVFRFTFRAIWFSAELLLYFATFFTLLLRHAGRPPQSARSRWLQWCSRRTLRIFSVRCTATGPRPATGLLVCNHLSYLDILVLVSLTPAVFVSKAEVKHWPVFGWFARLAGTLFVDRTRRSDVTRMNAAIDQALAAGNVLVLFPEGTSWNGSEVLPFKSPLLEPIVGSKHPLSVAHLCYSVTDGLVANDVCYWGDMTFFPHLVRLMTRAGVAARVRFNRIETPAADRKELARQLHGAVVGLSHEPP